MKYRSTSLRSATLKRVIIRQCIYNEMQGKEFDSEQCDLSDVISVCKKATPRPMKYMQNCKECI
jgi:hypothetical protein